jgi:ribosomal protein S6--L-glutamate ligase
MNRMRIAVVGERGGWHIEQLLAKLVHRGHAAASVSWRMVEAHVDATGLRFGPEPLATADVIVVRGMPGVGAEGARLDDVIFRMDALAQLEAGGTPVVNPPRALEIGIDKYLALAMLARAGLPVPRTHVVQGHAAALEAWESLGRDCVVKPLFGSRGRGVVRVVDADALVAAATPGVTYLQEYVPHPGWDLRILVIGDDTFSMRRRATAGEWRTNISLGGQPEAIEVGPAVIDLARRAARAVGTTIGGIDLVPGPDGPLVLEVNAVPAWRGLQTVVATDLTDAVAAAIERAAAGS